MSLPTKKNIKVALLIDEFFGAANTAFGGYGFLARHYIAKYIPNENIQIDVLLGKGSKHCIAETYHVEHTTLYKLPRRKWFAKKWLAAQNYDIYFSIELTSDFVLKLEPQTNKKLILWIQDPRPQYEWDEINTVKLFTETSYYNQNIYDLVHNWHLQNRVKFISQGWFLNQKAKDLYSLPNDVAIDYVPNPIDIDETFELKNHPKKNMIIFLGRLESVKRGWLFCEIAKQMPQYEFHVLGQAFRDSDKNSAILKPYHNIPNLHFEGHVEGEKKTYFLKHAKILVNTSIHEALPISFLEALSYGTLLVSNRDPENLTSQFGIHVGDVLGDGFDKVPFFVEAIEKLMQDENLRQSLATDAITYIKKYHNVPRFIQTIRNIITNEAQTNP